MRASIIGLSGLILAASATPAFAQEEESTSPVTVSANVALTTDYRFRGVGFSGGDIAVQGGVDVAHDSGFYVGTWASSMDGIAVAPFGSTELDVYAGWSGDLTDGISADVGVLYYIYPNAFASPTDYFEPYASISGSLGPAEVTVGAAYAFDGQNALGNNDSIYVYTDVGVGIPGTPVSVSGHVGYTDGSLAISTDGDYMDFSIGAEYSITENLSASLTYVTSETDLPSVDGFIDDAVVFTLSASF